MDKICDTVSLVFERKHHATVQNAMPRYQVTKLIVDPTDPLDLSNNVSTPEMEKGVPDSFADWLAQPSQVIAAPESDEGQGVFMALLNECPTRLAANQAPGHPPRPV